MLQLSESIDIAAPIDAVFQWVSDPAYIAVWDTSTISRASGHTVRRRGADSSFIVSAGFSSRRT